MKTMTKTKSKTKLAVTVGILLAGGAAAYALTGLLGNVGYNSFYVKCHDGSILMDNGRIATVIQGGVTVVSPSAGCQSREYWKVNSEMFCTGRRSPTSGKIGINTYKIEKSCKITRTYGYGYNPAQTYGYNPGQTYGYHR